MKRLILLLVALSGCTALNDRNGVQEIVCHAEDPSYCPPADDVPRAYRFFEKHVMPVDPTLPLSIHWYDPDQAFDIGPTEFKTVTGYSDLNKWPYEIHARNADAAMHELTHVALKESAGDPDDNRHEEFPGPWGTAHNLAIEVAGDAYRVALICEADCEE